MPSLRHIIFRHFHRDINFWGVLLLLPESPALLLAGCLTLLRASMQSNLGSGVRCEGGGARGEG